MILYCFSHASLSYGCYFQALFTKNESVQNCFLTNGNQDKSDIFKGLTDYTIEPEAKRLLINYIEKEYFEILLEDNSLKNIFDLNAENYLKPANKGFKADLDKIDSDIKIYIKEHTSLYLIFIEKISQIINWEVKQYETIENVIANNRQKKNGNK